MEARPLDRDTVPVVLERFSAHAEDELPAIRRALSRFGIPSETVTYYHTPRGQPRLRRRPHAHGFPATLPLLSVAHDGDFGVVAASLDGDIRGLGVDVVHVVRLVPTASDDRRMERFLRRLRARGDGWRSREKDERAVLCAVQFAVREAVGKALGTGLRLGLGMGARGGIPLREIRVTMRATDCEVQLDGRARARLTRLGAQRVSVCIERYEGYVLALATLQRGEERNLDLWHSVVRV